MNSESLSKKINKVCNLINKKALSIFILYGKVVNLLESNFENLNKNGMDGDWNNFNVKLPILTSIKAELCFKNGISIILTWRIALSSK